MQRFLQREGFVGCKVPLPETRIPKFVSCVTRRKRPLRWSRKCVVAVECRSGPRNEVRGTTVGISAYDPELIAASWTNPRIVDVRAHRKREPGFKLIDAGDGPTADHHLRECAPASH